MAFLNFIKDNLAVVISIISLCINAGLFSKLSGKVTGKERDEQILKEVGSLKKELKESIANVSAKCDDNERERLRSIIFMYGRRIPYQEYISGEEIADLQATYKRYVALKGNDIGHDEYERIIDYYNSRGWE